MRYPPSMSFEVTAKCNFRCPYCYCVWHEYPELAAPPLDTDGWRHVIAKCAADGVKEITFTGGEALLRPDLFDLIDEARAKIPDARLTLFTNGSLLTEDLILACKERSVSIATSLQGLSTYGAMTGTRRKPHRLLRLVARAAELGWPIAVSVTVTAANLREIADIFAAAALSRASTIQLGPMMAEGRGKAHQELMISRSEWEAAKAEIRALPDAGIPYAFTDEFICTCREQPSDLLAKWADAKPSGCPAGKTFGVVGPNGAYRICLHALP